MKAFSLFPRGVANIPARVIPEGLYPVFIRFLIDRVSVVRV
jgi:hypothetical protein